MSDVPELLISLPDGNWNDVPEKLPPIPAGTYQAVIDKYDVKDNADKTGKNLVFRLKMEVDGQSRYANYYVRYQPELDKIGLKFLANRAGLPPIPDGAPISIKSIIGRTVTAQMSTETFTDKATGIMEERNKLPNLLKV